MKYSVGQKVKIRSLEWYWDNVNRYGIIECGKYEFFEPMNEYCGKVVTIKRIDDDNYRIDADKGAFCWTDEMIEGLVEEEDLIPKFGEYSDNEPLNVPKMTSDFVKEHGLPCPEGYIFKDENGNVINATKIVLEKANTLKIQSDNMETKTHKGYCTTEVETTNESKKVAWLTFGDNDFADKVELDLSNRELIQEDGKWFVVKKKKEYPRTYEECAKVLLDRASVRNDFGYKGELLVALQKLLVCRDAYWKIYGEENRLGKPWEPDWNHNTTKYVIYPYQYLYSIDKENYRNTILAFPTPEMRDAFFENFKDLIEQCKELL